MHTGFRELRLRDGWFELNGQRIYLRSTHTGKRYPLGQVVPQNATLVRQDLIYAKVAGFNIVPFYRRSRPGGPARLLRRDRSDGL